MHTSPYRCTMSQCHARQLRSMRNPKVRLVTPHLSRTDCLLCLMCLLRLPCLLCLMCLLLCLICLLLCLICYYCVYRVYCACCGADASDVPRGRHARFGREGAGVQEAHPDVHRTHAGDHVPGREATEHRAVPRLGESSCSAWAKLELDGLAGSGCGCHGFALGYNAVPLLEPMVSCSACLFLLREC